MIEVTRIRFLKKKREGSFVGLADIVLNNCLAINYLSVHLSDTAPKYRVVYPVAKKDGFEKGFVYPITTELKSMIDEEVSGHIVANYDSVNS